MTPTDWDAKSVGFTNTEDYLRWLLQEKNEEIARLERENETLRAERDALTLALENMRSKLSDYEAAMSKQKP